MKSLPVIIVILLLAGARGHMVRGEPRHAGTCSRLELEAPIRRMPHFQRSEQTGVYVLTPPGFADALRAFAIEDNTFPSDDFRWVGGEHGGIIPPRPPFFFVAVTAQAFTRELGTGREPQLPGSPE